MEKLFFQKFPEYIGEIPVHEIHPNDMPSTPSPISDVQVPSTFEVGASETRECEELNENFEDECMMALFDEIPPT
jgi:hypothetical protein